MNGRGRRASLWQTCFPPGISRSVLSDHSRTSASRPWRCSNCMCGTTPGWTIRSGRRPTTGSCASSSKGRSCIGGSRSMIVRVPFDEGALTGQIRSDTVFPAGDWRAEYFSGDRRAEAERRGQALARLLDDQVQTLPELALRFCLSSPHVSTVIPGMRRAAHVRQNVAAAEKGQLTPGMLAQLEAHAWEKNWYPA